MNTDSPTECHSASCGTCIRTLTAASELPQAAFGTAPRLPSTPASLISDGLGLLLPPCPCLHKCRALAGPRPPGRLGKAAPPHSPPPAWALPPRETAAATSSASAAGAAAPAGSATATGGGAAAGAAAPAGSAAATGSAGSTTGGSTGPAEAAAGAGTGGATAAAAAEGAGGRSGTTAARRGMIGGDQVCGVRVVVCVTPQWPGAVGAPPPGTLPHGLSLVDPRPQVWGWLSWDGGCEGTADLMQACKGPSVWLEWPWMALCACPPGVGMVLRRRGHGLHCITLHPHSNNKSQLWMPSWLLESDMPVDAVAAAAAAARPGEPPHHADFFCPAWLRCTMPLALPPAHRRPPPARARPQSLCRGVVSPAGRTARRLGGDSWGALPARTACQPANLGAPWPPGKSLTAVSVFSALTYSFFFVGCTSIPVVFMSPPDMYLCCTLLRGAPPPVTPPAQLQFLTGSA